MLLHVVDLACSLSVLNLHVCKLYVAFALVYVLSCGKIVLCMIMPIKILYCILIEILNNTWSTNELV